ncbi:MAG: HAD-IIIA family hydrolase [Syntrophales bacterium]|mgnify:CR=1 FL=1|nr:HAD-IIIA family hydrolase [Syntrophales bacterium]MDD5232460.1 HAD-IIIA family hydrolase [Syntrophales bacterium]HPL62343.1 HAD-IIIA family hydrolase [Syntrophales bacterium]
MQPIDPETRRRILLIRHVIFDVDGVLTDGRIVYDDDGRELKFFDVKDGHGIKMLMRAGIGVVFLTGRTSRVVEFRARDLGVTDVFQGAKDKTAVFDKILESRGIPAGHVACVGDDITDIPLMRKAGFAFAVADAMPLARRSADYVTRRSGGRGAAREICELILKQQGKWNEVVSRYINFTSHQPDGILRVHTGCDIEKT